MGLLRQRVLLVSGRSALNHGLVLKEPTLLCHRVRSGVLCGVGRGSLGLLSCSGCSVSVGLRAFHDTACRPRRIPFGSASQSPLLSLLIPPCPPRELMGRDSLA